MISGNTLIRLEFNKLLEKISVNANSGASKEAILNIEPLSGINDIKKRFSRINELQKIASEGNPLRLAAFTDISHLIYKSRPDGAVLEAYELAAFIPVLTMTGEISSRMAEEDGLPFLRELTGQLTGHPDILGMLRKSVDSEGRILDSASPALSALRKDINKLEYNIQKKIEKIISERDIAVFLQDEFITKRSGRWVIPVRMDSKGQVPGVVHDVSKSGETAFIEPLSILNLSNKLENLIAEERAEEIRILRDISGALRERADVIEKEYEVLVRLDVLNCIVQFADTMDMQIPQLSSSGVLRLVDARHPLLSLALQNVAGDQNVVPLNLELGGNYTVMVITGANAGGKTISIKTIGLLVLMALSGMPVPADSSSCIPVANSLLIDIGDEQSIESSLSTFSAHISNISEILKKAGPGTLVLTDELGTGTDPDEGAALACALLEVLRKSGALVFATTHLTGIKGFVHRTGGMMNASMEFNQETLAPLYRLRMGEPGESHALEIAGRYGLPRNVIESAQRLFGSIKTDFDAMIADFNLKRAEYEKLLSELSRQKIDLDRKSRELDEKIADIERQRREIVGSAYSEAADIVADIKRRMYSELDSLKKMEKAQIRDRIKDIEQEQRIILQKRDEYAAEDTAAPDLNDIKRGEFLYVKSLGCDAEVVEVIQKHNRLRVSAGAMEIEVPVSDISFKRGKALTGMPREHSLIHEADETVQSRINLVGLHVDEAVSRLEPFLNHALLAGLQEVTIIHGIGKGILSSAVHEHLDGHPLVSEFRTGTLSEGGRGVTIAKLA